jgi:hypothetical protein
MLQGVPATPATDHHPQLPLPLADGHDRPDGTTHPGASEKGLLHQSRLDLANVECIDSSFQDALLRNAPPVTPSPQRSAGKERRRMW